MPTVLLELERVAHRRLGGPLTPGERGNPRHRYHVVQLDALHPGLELARDKPPRGRLARAAGTAERQEHVGIVRTGTGTVTTEGFPSPVRHGRQLGRARRVSRRPLNLSAF
jgi:hypothetical protein